MCFLISNNIAVILNPIKPNLNTIWILDLLNKYCVLCQQKNNRKWFIMANHLSILPWTALQYEQSKRCCKFGNWAGIAGILNSLLMDWLVRKPTLHWNSSGYFKLVDYMVAWLSLGYVNSGVFRFRFGCWSPGSCLYLSPARNLVNQRTDWTSFFLPPPARCFFFCTCVVFPPVQTLWAQDCWEARQSVLNSPLRIRNLFFWLRGCAPQISLTVR